MKTGSTPVFVILTPGFPRNESETACLPLQQSVVSTLKKEYPFLEILVISFQYPFETKQYKWNAISVYSLGGGNNTKARRLYTWYKAYRLLTKLNKTRQIKGILSFWLGECAFVGSWFAKRNALKHHVWICGQDAKAANKFIRWTKPCSTELIALSDFLASLFEKNYGIKPGHVIPPGIRNSLLEQPLPIKDIDIIGVGSLIPLKQFHKWIEIIKELKEERPDIKAVLCGEGPERAALEALIIKYQLQSNIEVTGQLAHEAILSLMDRCKLLLHTSRFEGFGMVCLEALNAGAGVISFTRPMECDIPGWVSVFNEAEMILKAKELLVKNVAPNRNIYFDLEESVRQLMITYNIHQKHPRIALQ